MSYVYSIYSIKNFNGYSKIDWDLYNFKEAFENAKQSNLKVNEGRDQNEGDDISMLAPAVIYDTKPYMLMEVSGISPKLGETTNQECYEEHILNKQIESKVGNFTQLTNNYIRKVPDNCSIPFKELLVGL
jgi:hypothetical protein